MCAGLDRSGPTRLTQRGLRGLIRSYQVLVSPWLAPRCRYWPSCSHYGLEAIELWGGARGLALTVGRVLRCHPWAQGGVDPVPQPLAGQSPPSLFACVLRRQRAQSCSSDLS